MRTPAHGTYAGGSKHVRDHTSMCDPCWNARIEYMREYRARRGRTALWPVTIRADLADSSMVGAVLAQSFRSAA